MMTAWQTSIFQQINIILQMLGSLSVMHFLFLNVVCSITLQNGARPNNSVDYFIQYHYSIWYLATGLSMLMSSSIYDMHQPAMSLSISLAWSRWAWRLSWCRWFRAWFFCRRASRRTDKDSREEKGKYKVRWNSSWNVGAELQERGAM